MDQNTLENLPLQVATEGTNEEYILSDPLDPLAAETKRNHTMSVHQELLAGLKMENPSMDEKNQLKDFINHLASEKDSEYSDEALFIKKEEPALDNDTMENGLLKQEDWNPSNTDVTNRCDQSDQDVKPILKTDSDSSIGNAPRKGVIVRNLVQPKRSSSAAIVKNEEIVLDGCNSNIPLAKNSENMKIDVHGISDDDDREGNASPEPSEQPVTTRILRSRSSAKLVKINPQHQTNAEHDVFIPSSTPSRGSRPLAYTHKDISNSSYSKPPNNHQIHGKLNKPSQTKTLANRSALYSQADFFKTTNYKPLTNSPTRGMKPSGTTTSMSVPSKATTHGGCEVTKQTNKACQNSSSETVCDQFKNSQRQGVSKSSPLKRFVCDHCGKAFALNRDLNRHLPIHSDTKSYACHICCKAFSTQRGLTCHEQQTVHSYENIKCDVCSRVCKNKYSLTVHIRTMHKKVITEKSIKPSVCDVCSKVYNNKKQMKNHCSRVHGKGLQFICNDCSATYRSKERLATHIMMNHMPPTVPCNKCSKLFVTSVYLNKHLRREHLIDTRRAYICEVCGKVSKKKYAHERHLLTHTNEMPIICEECGKCFRTKSNLDQHLRIHSDIRPYSCDLCEMSFKIRHHLQQHMAGHGMVSTPCYGKRGKQKRRRISSSSDSDS